VSLKDAWLKHEPAYLAGLLFICGAALGVIGSGFQYREDASHIVAAYAEASKIKDVLIAEQGQRIEQMSARFDQLAGKLDRATTKAAKAAKDAKAAVDNIPKPEAKPKHWWNK
jgi:hypothetical protein